MPRLPIHDLMLTVFMLSDKKMTSGELTKALKTYQRKTYRILDHLTDQGFLIEKTSERQPQYSIAKWPTELRRFQKSYEQNHDKKQYSNF
jgi:transcription initiation factor IIE alpha subunit